MRRGSHARGPGLPSTWETVFLRRAAAGSVGLGLSQAAGHVLEERPGDFWMFVDERLELPRRHAVAGQTRNGLDGRGTNALVDQRHLAEVVPGPELPADLPADLDL